MSNINCKGKLIDLATPKVMGILNVTPDSFFDGGKFKSDANILKHTEKMLSEGATFIDVGGYSSRPNGCSAEELEYVYDLANTFSNDDEWLSKSCDKHDKCYFTEGTTYKECNEKFIVDAIDSCNDISGQNTLLFMGSRNAFCGLKAFGIATGANACAEKYFKKAQKKQKAYNAWVRSYEKAYNDAKTSKVKR